MKGSLLEAYCALAKADCFLDIAREEYVNKETELNELRVSIRDIQEKIYKIGHEDGDAD